MQSAPPYSRKGQLGFSLIEVLVSLAIMAVGLLGMGRLMVAAIHHATATDVSSRAAQSAHGMAEAMRATATANVSSYSTAYGDSPLTGTEPRASDLKFWLDSLRRLPEGDGKIEFNGDFSEATVTVRFNNCLGTLSALEATRCNNSSDTDARQRSIALWIKLQ